MNFKEMNTMRKLILILLAVMPAMCNCGGTPSQPPSFSVSQVSFVKEIVAGTPVAVAVDEEGRIYAAQKDGTIKVFSDDGLTITTLKGTDRDGQNMLKHPADLVVSGKNIFVIDRAIPAVVIL